MLVTLIPLFDESIHPIVTMRHLLTQILVLRPFASHHKLSVSNEEAVSVPSSMLPFTLIIVTISFSNDQPRQPY